MNSNAELRMAFGALVRHKLRSGLTLLGMIFGVGAVVAMLTIGEGARRESEEVAARLGIDSLIVQSKVAPAGELERVRAHSLGLRLQDLSAARETIPFILGGAGEKRIVTYDVHSEHAASKAEVLGVTQSWPEIAQLEVVDGAFWTAEQGAISAQMAVVGANTARELFGDHNPLNSLIKINHAWFRVIGVVDAPELKTTELRGVKLADDRSRIFIPLETALNRLYINPLESELDAIRLRVAPDTGPEDAAKVVEQLIRIRHSNQDDTSIVVPAALLETQERTQKIFTIVLACIGGISLLVGGIGIMNVMLAAVVERTHEIGLMRAVGARTRDVARQFLVEGSLLSLVGGVAGIGFGLALAFVAQVFTGWTIAFSMSTAAIALLLCVAVGIGFCLYPALQAARMDPIAALRKEMG